MFGTAQTAVEESHERQAQTVPSGERIECACGCQRWFEPKRKTQRFYSPQCRNKAKRLKSVPIKVPTGQCQRIKTLLARQRSGVPRKKGPEHPLLPAIRLAALWFNNRLSEENGTGRKSHPA